jgi:hypothetical protein
MKDPIRYLGLIAAAGTILISTAISGCGSMSSNHIDCNIVRIQTDAGRTQGEIAGALGVSESDVASCHAPAPTAPPPES